MYGPLSEVTKHIGNALASDGMGMRSGIGGCAGIKLTDSRVFSDTIDSLLDSIIVKSGGAVNEVRIMYHGSAAGGPLPPRAQPSS